MLWKPPCIEFWRKLERTLASLGNWLTQIKLSKHCLRVIYSLLPVVPHKAVAEVSKIGNLYERLVVVNQGWQSESTDGPKGAWGVPLFLALSLTIYLPTYLPAYLPTYLSIFYVSMYLSIYLSIYLSLSLFPLPIHPSIYLPTYLSI